MRLKGSYYLDKNYYHRDLSNNSSDPDQLYYQAENAIQLLIDYCYTRNCGEEEKAKLNEILDALTECHENSELDFIYNNNLDGSGDMYND